MIPLLFLHGYGVRGWFWEALAAELSGSFDPVLAPDLDMTDLAAMISSARSHLASAPGALVVGHSLGASIAARLVAPSGAGSSSGGGSAPQAGPLRAAGAVLIAPPAQGRSKTTPGVLRFLLKHHLVPDILIRPRFFSQTPTRAAKAVFARAERETPQLQAAVFRGDAVDPRLEPPDCPVLVLASEGDRIIPAFESRAVAQRLGARLHLFRSVERVGHNDFATAPTVVARVADLIRGVAAQSAVGAKD